MYWTIKKAKIKCPQCKKVSIWQDLQTHYMGEVGSCLNYYELGGKVEELKGIKSAEIKPPQDHFVGICPKCEEFVEFGAKIKNERVVQISPVK